MADAITDAIKNIRTRRRKLEAELKLLVKAEEALRQIASAGGNVSQKAKGIDVSASSATASFVGGVSNSVLAALRDLGEAESGDVISHIRKKYLPDANENTIRSLLSVWAMKGRVIRTGKKYSLPKEAHHEATPA